MTRVTIVETRDDLYVVQTDDGVCTLPRTAYFELKYAHMHGNRIFHSWEDGVSVEETYNDGIFNCTHRGRRIQISDGDGIATAVLRGDAAAYVEIFDQWYEATAQKEVVKTLLAPYGHRVAITKAGYVVDGMFLVDEHGMAHVAAGEPSAETESGYGWRSLCIVVSVGGLRSLSGMSVACGEHENRVNSVTATIVSKLMFLLRPNMDDLVFANQLPAWVGDRLHERHEPAGTRVS